MGGGVEATPSINGAAGGTVLLPLDLHIANLGQGRAAHGINTVAVSIAVSIILNLTGGFHIDLNRAVGVDGHIFICTQTVAVVN